MQRVKTFLSDGSNPNGRWFATDANAIQDAAAALTDLAQHISVADLAIGESSLLLSRFGAGQAQLAGMLRVTAGMLPGVFTTTQRDAIVSGKRPTGMVIFNSTTGQLEVNVGSDTTPNWQAAGTAVSGDLKMSALAVAPTGWLPCDGAAISRSTYAALFAAIGSAYGAGDGSTTFNVPDLRGRMPVGLGTHTDVNTLGKNEGAALGNRRPAHKHTVNDPSHTHPLTVTLSLGGATLRPKDEPASSNGQTIAGGANGVQAATTGITVGPQTGAEPTDSAAFAVVNFFIKM